MANRWGNNGNMRGFIFFDSKISAGGDHSHEIKRRFLLGRKAKINLLLLLSCFSRVQLCVTQWQQSIRLRCPWDSPGKNTGVGCHFLLQCTKWKVKVKSCPTLSNPMDCSPAGSSVHGIFQASVLEWGHSRQEYWNGVKQWEIAQRKPLEYKTQHHPTTSSTLCRTPKQ